MFNLDHYTKKCKSKQDSFFTYQTAKNFRFLVEHDCAEMGILQLFVKVKVFPN